MNIILLRFRDLTQNINTIDEHNKISLEKGKVLWGWWKKDNEPYPDPILKELSEEIEKYKDVHIYFVNSDTNKYYKSKLNKIYYDFGGYNMLPPDPAICPEYYSEKELAAWFEIEEIVEIDPSQLSEFVLSHDNRVTRNHSSIPDNNIGLFFRDIDILAHPVSMWFLCNIEDFESVKKQSVLNISSGNYPTKGKYILHLSDLHFGDVHAYRNPLSSNKKICNEMLIDDLLDDIKAFNENAIEEIGLVIISGDLTWKADTHEFSNAEKFAEQLCKELGLSPQHVIFVPGNHDIEWLKSDNKIDQNAELNYRNFYKNVYNSNPSETMLKINRYSINNNNVCVIAINSCRLESEENAGYGFIGNEQIKAIINYFDKNKDIDYSFAVLHHHVLPVNYLEDYDFKTKQISMLLDSEALLRTLISCGVDTIIHGHQHQPYFSTIRRIVPEYIKNGKRTVLNGSINVVGAGSMGVDKSKTNSIGRNSYNIIEIEDKNISIYPRIKSSSGIGFYSDDPITFNK